MRIAISVCAMVTGGLLLLPLRAARSQAATLTPVRLPKALSPDNSNGAGINNSGAVAATAYRSRKQVPFVWQAGRVTLLPVPRKKLGGYARDLNDAGHVVGACLTRHGGMAALWRDGRCIELGTLGGKTSVAVVLNERDQVIGSSATVDDRENNQRHAFLWENGVMTDLGAPSGESFAHDLNETGLICGSYGFPGPEIGFTWNTGLMEDLVLQGADRVVPSSVNDAGQMIVSVYTDDGRASGVLLNGQFTWAGPGVILHKINNEGIAIGSRTSADGSYAEPIVWKDGIATPLQQFMPAESGVGVGIAKDINDVGQILVFASFGRRKHGFAIINLPQ